MKTKEKVYHTTDEAKEALEGQGYKHLFEVTEDNMLQSADGVTHPVEDVELEEVYAIDENSDKNLTSVYALSTRGGAKGVMIDGFGVTGSVHRTNFLKHLSSKRTIRG